MLLSCPNILGYYTNSSLLAPRLRLAIFMIAQDLSGYVGVKNLSLPTLMVKQFAPYNARFYGGPP